MAVGGCAASKEEIERATNSGYNADFSTVYGECLIAVTELYPRTAENAVDGVIRTAWHRVAVEHGGSRRGVQQGNQVDGTHANGGLTGTASADMKEFFIRFRVHVVGGKPWRVRVVGEASERDAGDTPMPLKGAEVPPWLKGRSDALRLDIHKRLKRFAIKVAEEIPQAEGTIITIDEPSSFGDIPDGAQELLTGIHRALSLRSFGDLRAQLADDVQWSSGEVGNVDTAMVMWQADSSLLEAMRIVIAKGCVTGDGAVTVSCPRAYSQEPSYRGHRLIAEKRGSAWLVTAFVKGE
ncbi:MAG: hypothetical protein GY811_17210 [Myxococcales bacterium]|nr:hypothetical protein [Myxococcales bacterium]